MLYIKTAKTSGLMPDSPSVRPVLLYARSEMNDGGNLIEVMEGIKALAEELNK